MILHCQVTILPSYTLFFGKVTKCSPYPRYGKLCFMSWRRKHLHKLFGILLKGRGVPSPPLIYLFRHLYQYALMDIYFIRYVINYVIFFAQTVSPLSTGDSFGLSPVPFGAPTSFCFLNTSSLSGPTRRSKLILYDIFPGLRTGRFSKKSWVLVLENDVKQSRPELQCFSRTLGLSIAYLVF